MTVRHLTAICLLSFALVACALPETNFSQWPGWSEYLAAHPPSALAATAEEQVLLHKHRPRFFLPAQHAGLIDFYADYIASGELRDRGGRLISSAVTPAILNAHKDDPRVAFTHRPSPKAPTATVYARTDGISMDLGASRARRFSLLTYHAVFRHSGLAGGFDGWRASIVGAIADLDDWHQLDHYTAATVVLDEAHRPVALMLQQHNYTRTYVFGERIDLPADGRPLIDVAIRSNELFPHLTGRVARRAVRFMSVEDMRYMLGFGAKPRVAEDDITEGVAEASYQISFLPHDDAFYTFKGFLGARRRLPGRDGPPGADYNTLPEVKPLASLLLFGYWREGNREDLARYEATYAKTGNRLDFARGQASAFAKSLAKFAEDK